MIVFGSVLTVFLVGMFYFLFFYAIFEMKLDYLKTARALILWYTEYQPEGGTKRRYIKICTFKKKPIKP